MKTKNLIEIALMTALLCILAPISIPIGSVALTAATFAIYLSAYLLQPKQALATVGLYLLLGAIGLPVFSGYLAGIGRFAAPGGGYLIGYLPLAGISSFAVHRFSQPLLQILGIFFATLMLYLFGICWLIYTTGCSISSALSVGILFFLPVDLVKILIAVSIGRKLQKHISKT